MCLFKAPKPQVVTPEKIEEKEKTSAENQKATEAARIRAGITSKGLASTILTSGLGDTSPIETGSVRLGT